MKEERARWKHLIDVLSHYPSEEIGRDFVVGLLEDCYNELTWTPVIRTTDLFSTEEVDKFFGTVKKAFRTNPV